MSAQRVSTGSRDLISSLPDEVLGKVMSLLPTRLAASTSVLSKRWRNLLALVDKLDLSDESGDPRGFSDYVDKTLALLNDSSIIKTFSLNCQHKHDSTQVGTWIRTVLERGFLEIHLESVCSNPIETESFTSNTLVKLTLSKGFYLSALHLSPRGGVFFPKLKTLSLFSGDGDPEAYELLITGCPVLEELLLRHGSTSAATRSWMVLTSCIAVSNPSIKRMTISYPFRGYCEPPDSEVFLTPRLVYLDYSGYVSGQYYVDLSSLVEARLDLRPERDLVEVVVGAEDRLNLRSSERVLDEDEDDNTEYNNSSGCGEDDDDDNTEYNNSSGCGEDDDDSVFADDDDDDDDDDSDSEDDADDVLPDVTDLVTGISNVKTLHLSPDSLEMFHLCCKSMPVFNNLRTLSFESDRAKSWQVVPLLLKNSPNLETLVIKGLVHHVTDGCGDACVCIAKKKKEVCCLSTCQVKVLTISGYGGTRKERKQMRHFLGNLECLETVKVGVEVDRGEDSNVNNNYQRITNALTKLPRASTNCRIHFF